ncbi:MAG: hypothetical protein Q7U16_05990 [Agitococcus sp.]|nr:hypothetical protein [Agitococcus sp.]
MKSQKRWLNAFFAWIHNEIDASSLEAYQRAGNVVFNLVLEVEVQRVQDISVWDTPTHYQIQNLCLWNAYVLQTLGDQLLNAEYRLHPKTEGFAPPLTAKQIETFYLPVESWLNHAYQAKENAIYTLKDLGVAVPAVFPTWLTLQEMLKHRSNKKEVARYLEGLLNAAITLSLHIDALFKQIDLSSKDDTKETVHKLQQLHANAKTTLEYVIQLWGNELTESLHGQIELSLRRVIHTLWPLGQLLAMPSLVDKINIQQWTQTAKTTASPSSRPLAFSQQAAAPVNSVASLTTNDHLWSLSAELIRKQKQQDAYAISLLTTMWKNDSQPQLALQIQYIIQQALAKGYIAYATHQQLPYFKQCPWSAIYITKRPIMIAGDPLRVHQLFTYVCDADRVDDFEPKSFGNRILRL